jgi:hypothetical protein
MGEYPVETDWHPDKKIAAARAGNANHTNADLGRAKQNMISLGKIT